ncbi:MAG: AAA family ATPase [Alphaproteobacteria bacterium]|nr:AAA family ATPase [Alphaproteobacteria bacterium]
MNAAVDQVGNERDAHVVEEICGYVTGIPPRSFFLFAGAGSGKTRTLVEVLRRITGVVEHAAGGIYASKLHVRGQSVRVITYTKNAARVVTSRLGDNRLTEVSTIHSFCWDLVKGFDEDIRQALMAKNTEELAKAKAAAQAKTRGESENDRRKYAELEAKADELRAIPAFRYHPDHNTYGEGALSHQDVLRVAAWLLRERPTLQRIVQDRHPLLLIDESQDTMRGVLDALFYLTTVRPGHFTLGLLGDHRQRIYLDGRVDLPSHIPATWARPALQMNHRSQERIVRLINAIWEADIEGRTQPKTGVYQHPRSEKQGGEVRIFVGDTAKTTSAKLSSEADCARLMAQITSAEAWTANQKGYKTLALEHKLGAKRGDFYDIYCGMFLLDKEAATPDANGERMGPAMVRPLLGGLLELAACVRPDGTLDEFAAVAVLHRHDALAKLPSEHAARATRLAELHDAISRFAVLCRAEGALVKQVLAPILEANVLPADSRVVAAYRDERPPPPEPEREASESKESRQRRGWHLLMKAPWAELARYRTYLGGKAPFATHQVVKGSEFKHVMVVMDDAEAGGNLFSYDKLFGAEGLSKSDKENIAAGKETVIDRTLRLLYVTCSRAEESLALVLWAKDTSSALTAINACGWFAADEVVALS